MCECLDTVFDKKTSTEVCIYCGTVTHVEGVVEKEWFACQDSVQSKAAPYKYSRTTHFRNTLDRLMGWSRVDGSVVEAARAALEGYPDDAACHHTVLKQARLPYQHTTTIRRRLGYAVPTLTVEEKTTMNSLFEFFCVEYERMKASNRKNLPSVEYIIHHFLLYVDRPDVAALVHKRYMTPEKHKATADIIDRIIAAY